MRHPHSSTRPADLRSPHPYDPGNTWCPRTPQRRLHGSLEDPFNPVELTRSLDCAKFTRLVQIPEGLSSLLQLNKGIPVNQKIIKLNDILLLLKWILYADYVVLENHVLRKNYCS